MTVDESTIHGEVVRFLAVGALNTGLTYLLYLGLLVFLDYQPAYAVAYVTGIALAYLLNARVVFRKDLALRDFLRFPLVYVVQYVAGSLLLHFLVEQTGISTRISMAIVIVIATPLTFALSRMILRRKAA